MEVACCCYFCYHCNSSCYYRCCLTRNSSLRKKYLNLQRDCFIKLIKTSLPIFVAAGIANSVSAVILYISNCNGNDTRIEITLSFFYALLSYLISKCIIFGLYHQHYQHYSIIKLLQSHTMIELIEEICKEHTAFALKELLVVIVLRKYYQENGLGTSFGSYFLALVICFLVIFCSKYIIVHILPINNIILQNDLIQFDAVSFAFPFAYLFTVLFGLFAIQEKFGFFRQNSYLFRWESNDLSANRYKYQDDDFVGFGADGSLYFFYAIIVTVLTSLILVLEEGLHVCVRPDNVTSNSLLHHSHHDSHDDQIHESFQSSSLSKPPKPQTSTTTTPSIATDHKQTHSNHFTLSLFTKETMVLDANQSLHAFLSRSISIIQSTKTRTLLIDLWHNSLGCFCGIAWFVLVIDDFVYLFGNDIVMNLIIAIVVAVLITWRGPSFMASITMSQSKNHKKLKVTKAKIDFYQQERKAEKALRGAQELDPEPSIDEPSISQKTSRTTDSSMKSTLINNYCRRGIRAIKLAFHYIRRLFAQVMIYRRAATLSATRLTIGWLWETVILFIFEYIAIVVQVSASSNVAIQFFAAFVIIIITYFMHLWILQLEDFTQRESMVLESLSESQSISQGSDIDISIHNPVNSVQLSPMNSHHNSNDIICDEDIHNSSIHDSNEVITTQPSSSSSGSLPQIPSTPTDKQHISTSDESLV